MTKSSSLMHVQIMYSIMCTFLSCEYRPINFFYLGTY